MLGQHDGKIIGDHAVNLIENRTDKFIVTKAGMEKFKNLLNKFLLNSPTLVFFLKTQVLIGKSGIAQKGR